MNNLFNVASELEDIHFRYERLASLIGCLQMTVEEVAEVRGLPENSLSYSLYEIESNMRDNAERFEKTLDEIRLELGKKDTKGVQSGSTSSQIERLYIDSQPHTPENPSSS